MSVTGVVLGVSPDWRGSDLTVATTTTTTVLSVVDAVDFDEDGGWLVIADETTPRQYVSVDFDADTVTLAAAVGAVFEEYLPVSVWDATVLGGSRVVEYVAQVQLDGGAGAMDATVPHDLVPSADTDALVGASVVVEETADDDSETPEWVVVGVVGREPVFSGTYIEPGTLPATSSGQTFSIDAPPATADGYAEDHAWWQVVDGEVLGFWRAVGGAWLPQEIVTAEALRANNAFIDALQTVDLSTVNLKSVNIEGGAIYIAKGVGTSIDQEFSGTALPTGWVATKTYYNGTGAGGAAVPGVSVTSAPPAGATGSALLIDYGPAGHYNSTQVQHDYSAAGLVTTTLPDSSDAEIRVRFKINTNPNDGTSQKAEDARLIIRETGAYASTYGGWNWRGVTLDLVPRGRIINDGKSVFRVQSMDAGFESIIQSHVLPVDPATTWAWAHLKVQAGSVYAKVWADGSPEPEFTISAGAGIITGAGEAAAGWSQAPISSNVVTRGQKVWIDRWVSSTFDSGFVVNPDGTGEWPAIGLAPGDAAWRQVNTSGQPSFQNGWTGTLNFRKTPTGDVTLNGTLTIPAGGHNTTIFTLPTTHRPTVAYENCFAWQNAAVRLAGVTVNTDGTVTWLNFGNTGGTTTSFSVTFSTL